MAERRELGFTVELVSIAYDDGCQVGERAGSREGGLVNGVLVARRR